MEKIESILGVPLHEDEFKFIKGMFETDEWDMFVKRVVKPSMISFSEMAMTNASPNYDALRGSYAILSDIEDCKALARQDSQKREK